MIRTRNLASSSIDAGQEPVVDFSLIVRITRQALIENSLLSGSASPTPAKKRA